MILKPVVGRLTGDAEVRNLQGGKSVVHFIIAENSYYKAKDAQEYTQDTTYYECSYWRNAQAAVRLTKGSLVEASGRIGARGYIDKENEVKAVLTLNVDTFQILYRGKSDQGQYEDFPDIADYHE